MSDETTAAEVKRNQDARVILAMHLDDLAEGKEVDFDEVYAWWESLVDSCVAIITALTEAEREAAESKRVVDDMGDILFVPAWKLDEATSRAETAEKALEERDRALVLAAHSANACMGSRECDVFFDDDRKGECAACDARSYDKFLAQAKEAPND